MLRRSGGQQGREVISNLLVDPDGTAVVAAHGVNPRRIILEMRVLDPQACHLLPVQAAGAMDQEADHRHPRRVQAGQVVEEIGRDVRWWQSTFGHG